MRTLIVHTSANQISKRKINIMAVKTKNKKYTSATGRRRTSSARVRLHKGKEKSSVNNISSTEYFPGSVNKTIWDMPFILTDTVGKYYVTVKVTGGGTRGQLEASVHGIAKAFNTLDREKYRAPLRAAGLLTRDARIRERRKVGMGGKARRKKQSPKR